MLKTLFGPPDIKKMKDKGDIDGLIKALQYTKDWQLQFDAAHALGILGDTKAVLPLINALDYWKSFRFPLIKSLGLLKDEQAVKPLLKLLQERDPRDYRTTLIWALARLRNTQAVSPLIEILKDKSYKNQTDREYAGAALSLIGSPSVEPLLNLAKSDKDQYYIVVELLGKIKDAHAVGFLIDLISDSEIMQKEGILPGKIITALGEIGDKRAFEPLNALAHGNNRELANRADVALQTLGVLSDSVSNPLSDAFLDDLTKDYKDKSTDELINLLLADNPNKSSLIPLVLGRRKSTQAVEALCKNIGGERVPYDVRLEVIIALGKIKDPKAIEPLIYWFDHDWTFKREIFIATEDSLSKLGWSPH